MSDDRITTKAELRRWLQADAEAIRLRKGIIHMNVCWRFLKALRKYEYNLNRPQGIWQRLMRLISNLRWYYWSVKTGISVHPNCFGAGLALWHFGALQVNYTCKGGKNVTIQSGVCVMKDVTLGNGVYLAPGAKVLEGVSIADDVTIGANAVVTHSITEPGTVWAGVPAKRIR